MALEIEGRIARKLNVQTGTSARGAWSKQEFILEYQEGNFPSQICMNVWGEDKVRDLDKYQVGDKVRISFNLSSREFNGRWYTDVRAWRIEPAGVAAPQNAYQQAGVYPAPAGGSPAMPGSGMAPAGAPMQTDVPAPSIDDLPGSDDEDDLPF